MNGPIRRVGYAVTVLILVLVAQLTYLQIVDAHKLANDPRNVRTQLRSFNRPRGEILTADGEIVARSVRSTARSADFKYQREYPMGTLFAQVSGYQSFVFGSAGVEKTYEQALTGRNAGIRLNNLGNLGNLFSGNGTGNVVLSLTKVAQQAAHDALGDQKGSVVALDVKTGAVLALYSNPTYDPTGLAGHNTAFVELVYKALTTDPENPLRARAYSERFPPGSTFKVLTTAAALGAGIAQPDTQFPEVKSFAIPGTESILSNFEVNGEPEQCGGSLVESLVISCNTTFAKLGYDLHDQFPPAMSACGINDTPPIDLDPGAVASIGPLVGADRPRFALAGIGQGDVFVTPLQMAMVAAGIANGGVEMKPHVVSEIQDADGATLASIDPSPWKTCMSPQTADALKTMMVQVVERGTGTLAQIPGVAVAGKTGTAQTQPGKPPHAWFIAFAPAEAPRYAVAVLVEAGGTLNENATGGQVAAPIAKQILQTLLQLPH